MSVSGQKYEPGALQWAFEHVPDLVQRLHATEVTIDRLAGTGPTEAAIRVALAEYAAVWHELVARYRANQERRAQKAGPMPPLQADALVAVGNERGDGDLGTEDVVKRRG